MELEELKKDLDELKRLADLATREKIKQLLSIEIRKLDTQVAKKVQDASKAAPAGTPTTPDQNKLIQPQICNVKIINYAWDQSPQFVKLYVTLNGVKTLPETNIQTKFTVKSIELQVLALDSKNYTLTINNLMHPIRPEDSYHKVKTDMVVVFLRKQSSSDWPYVTQSEQRAKDAKTPKFDEHEEPGQGLMNLMKQMYDDGDDEMKRTIAKAWVEAREKQSRGDVP